MQFYGKEVAEVIIKCRDVEFEISDDGIRPVETPVDNAEFDKLINWTPHCELDGNDAPDPLTTPALPFPFTASQLAAFLLDGCGFFVREKYGDWADGPDPQELTKLGTRAVKARQALIDAFNAYRAAEFVVGAYDHTHFEKIQELEKQRGPWLDAKEARQRIKNAHSEADAYDADRRKRMVNQLLMVSRVPHDDSLLLAQDAVAQLQTTAPMVRVGHGKWWTPEKLAELKAYRETHLMSETVQKFGISEQRIRQLLPSGEPQKKAYTGFKHLIK